MQPVTMSSADNATTADGPDPVGALSSVARRGFSSASEAAQAMFSLIHELVGLRICVLSRVDLDANTLTVVEALDQAGLGVASGTVVPASGMPGDYVARSSMPLRMNDLDTSPFFRESRARTKLGLRSYLGVPLQRSDGTVWGTLAATDTVPRELTDVHLQMLAIFAKLLVLEFEREEQRDALAAQAQMLTERLAMAEALQEERLRACKLQTVVEAAATVSHGINNPLTVLQLRLGRIERRCSVHDQEATEDIDAALEAAGEIHSVTVQLRSVVRPVSMSYLAGGNAQMLDLAASTVGSSRPPS
jgi:GAF domain-containing protein